MDTRITKTISLGAYGGMFVWCVMILLELLRPGTVYRYIDIVWYTIGVVILLMAYHITTHKH